jgi:hypothetical protein
MDMPGSARIPAIRTEALKFAYGEGTSRFNVLFDISIEVPPGQLAAPARRRCLP